MINQEEVDKLGEAFQKFRPPTLNAQEHFNKWSLTTSDHTLKSYINQCFADAFLHISKYADNEKEFYQWKLELDTKRWEYEKEWDSDKANFFLKQMHIDKVLIECQSVGLECELIIQSNTCCRSCARHHGKRVSLVSVLKGKHLPYASCKREDFCTCTYKVVPQE